MISWSESEEKEKEFIQVAARKYSVDCTGTELRCTREKFGDEETKAK
jgi:hypothetical protein